MDGATETAQLTATERRIQRLLGEGWRVYSGRHGSRTRSIMPPGATQPWDRGTNGERSVTVRQRTLNSLYRKTVDA